MSILIRYSPWLEDVIQISRHAAEHLLCCPEDTNDTLRNQELIIFMPSFMMASGISFL